MYRQSERYSNAGRIVELRRGCGEVLSALGLGQSVSSTIRRFSMEGSMKSYISAAKELSRGVFWVVDDKLLAYPFVEDFSVGVAKSGNTYNHKKLWPYIRPAGNNHPYNYYPRGRVDIDNKNRVVIYLNPNVPENMLSDIRKEFGIIEVPIIRYDHSEHYKCHLDDGWKPDNS